MKYKRKIELIPYDSITEHACFFLAFFLKNKIYKVDILDEKVNEAILKSFHDGFSDYTYGREEILFYLLKDKSRNYYEISPVELCRILNVHFSLLAGTLNDLKEANIIEVEEVSKDNKMVNSRKIKVNRDRLNEIFKTINFYINASNLIPYDKEADFYLYHNGIKSSIDLLNNEFFVEDKNIKELYNNKEILEYMKKIVNIECDIYSLKNRFIYLQDKRKNIFEDNLLEEYGKVCIKRLQEIDSLNIEICELNRKNTLIPKIDCYLDLNGIEKPEFNLSKPLIPKLRKSYLFNSKKIKDENDKKIYEYELKMKEYEEARNKYEKLLVEYDKKVKEEKNNAKNKYENALKQIDLNKEIIEEKNKEKKVLEDNLIKNIDEDVMKTESYQIIKKLEYEMDYILESIKPLIKIKQELYSYNLIYGKYRNFVSISSFIDYLMSGRCESLEGANGAYNLYETETRMNLIIDKLDVIINKLDCISQNQYYLYKKLNETNDYLNGINNLFLVNNMLQVEQVSKLEKVIDKADEIVYNTKVASYYSKKIADYTETLVYMKALDRLV